MGGKSAIATTAPNLVRRAGTPRPLQADLTLPSYSFQHTPTANPAPAHSAAATVSKSALLPPLLALLLLLVLVVDGAAHPAALGVGRVLAHEFSRMPLLRRLLLLGRVHLATILFKDLNRSWFSRFFKNAYSADRLKSKLRASDLRQYD